MVDHKLTENHTKNTSKKISTLGIGCVKNLQNGYVDLSFRLEQAQGQAGARFEISLDQ